MKKKIHMVVSGRVQGVYYRYSTLRKASELGLTGWVRNLRDGRVEVLAEGDETLLAILAEWCRSGPPGALVTDLHTEWEDHTGEYATFEIIY